jgi:phage major head subunit gpT-like protein
MLVRQLFPDLNLTTMLPLIDEVVQLKYGQYPPEYPEVYRMEKSKRAAEQTTELTGFGQMVVVPEGDQTKYDDPIPGFNKTYQHVQYSLGFKVSRVAMDDDQFGYIKKLAQELGRSAHETQEVVAVNPFNQGFNSSFTGPDGKTLFATAITHYRAVALQPTGPQQPPIRTW